MVTPVFHMPLALIVHYVHQRSGQRSRGQAHSETVSCLLHPVQLQAGGKENFNINTLNTYICIPKNLFC